MNFKIFLIIYLQLIYTSLANLKLTPEDRILPTKTKKKHVDMMEFHKLVVNDSAELVLEFKFEAKDNLYEKQTDYFFNGEPINFNTRKDIKKDGIVKEGKKIFQLIFTKFTEKIAGEYLLVVTANNGSVVNATGNIFSPPFLHEFLESRRSTDGGRMEVACKFTAFPPVIDELQWTPVSMVPQRQNNFRLMAQNGSRFEDLIIWDFLKKEDAGYYRCSGKNRYGNDSVILQLRVKDKLAPLWPFIGIVIEVIILFAVIVFYERQKSSKKAAEAESNPIRQSLLAETKGSEIDEGVRHRNSVD